MTTKPNLKFEGRTFKANREEETMTTKPDLKLTDEVIIDPFDPANLRIKDDFAEDGIKKHLNVVPVGKPGAQTWFRVHPAPEYQMRDAGLVSLKEENEFYLVHPQMAAELENEFTKWTIYTIVTRQNVVRLWPIRQVGPDGKSNLWWDSARDAAEQAINAWTRIVSNRHLGAYEILTSVKNVEPQWPELPLKELLRIAFKNDRMIDRFDHPVVQQLRGMA